MNNKKKNSKPQPAPAEELLKKEDEELSEDALDSVAGGISAAINPTLNGGIPGVGVK